MSKILKKVTLTHNIKKKIYFVSFKNEMTNNERKTKSVGSDENKALKSKENIEKMINEEIKQKTLKRIIIINFIKHLLYL